MKEKIKTEKGFIQIPLLIIVIASIIIVSTGTGIVLHKQGKLTHFIANISEVFKGNKKTISPESENTNQREIPEQPLVEQEQVKPQIKEEPPVEENQEIRQEKLSQQEQELEQIKLEAERVKQAAKAEAERLKNEGLAEEARQREEERQEEIFGTEVAGIISQNTTWTIKDSPYVITDDILIKKGVNLIIDPGVVIKFKKGKGRTNMGGFAIINEGNIIAEGIPNNKIIFTSAEVTPQLGDWGTILTVNGGSVKFNYVEVKYASSGISSENARSTVIENSHFHNNGTGVFLNKGDAIISNNIFEKNYAGISFMNIPYSGPFDDGTFDYRKFRETKISNNIIRNNVGQSFNEYHAGIHIELSSSLADLHLLTIYKNDIHDNSHGINIRETGGFNPSKHNLPIIKQNNIYNNNGYAIQLWGESSIEIDMSNNWWGTTETKKIDDLIYDYYDSWRPGIINYQPIITSKILDAGVQ